MTSKNPIAVDLLDYIAGSPSSYHCAETSAGRLAEAGFQRLHEHEAWALTPGGRYFVARAGAVVAFRLGASPACEAGFRVIGAHTDSPNLRIKPQPDVSNVGYAQLGVEVYGGVLTHTWLDRDLGLAGRVSIKDASQRPGSRTVLLHIDRPLLRIPSLAIHLNRDVRPDGLKLNEQQHLSPVLALDPDKTPKKDGAPGVFRALLGEHLGVSAEHVLAWDLGLVDVTPPTLGGRDGDMIFAPRLDNQAMCHAALTALLRCADSGGETTAVVCLYDHEEVGSLSLAGADGTLGESVLSRIAATEGPGATPAGLVRAAALSYQISADMAHAVHPNYKDKHEPQHHPQLNGGPVIKVNASQRYATCAETAALFEALCQDAQVPYQKFVNRTDLACGSTIGPIAAGRLGLRTVDVGNAMLSMHSIREHSGALDPARMVEVMTRFFAN